jgi:hypothetical protein
MRVPARRVLRRIVVEELLPIRQANPGDAKIVIQYHGNPIHRVEHCLMRD